MRLEIRAVMLVAAMAVTQAGMAQAPAGSTGQCKDGTYTTAASKMGACRGHKGVKEWYAASTGAAAGGSSSRAGSSPEAHTGSISTASPSTMSDTPAKGASTSSTATQTRSAKPAAGSGGAAPGGGPGMVWLNTESKVYHCPGTKFYGKTKAGSYMTEAEAKAKGAHADHGHPCSK